ncbi:sigma-70 family RNA polymerase sigma factor [Paraflavitalea pollutisoli]|uniref:sigma-70 family RNA polymerase sigma factor n=1 Tax=Paraflavitalea pollutisoli TaxID=3034143 RepID=UPI0023EBA279|nr:sigma-70 family RNA polymerase sigma factor [Paraflavitalea sp. H1-2-19X]
MNEWRPLLTTYAYNITGSLEEARDIVQDAFLKFIPVDSDRIEDKKNYLIRTVINLAINAKKRQQKTISEYPGPWLPEPVATERADAGIVQEEVLSYSLMVLLEKLNVKQRAVFILKEAFDYDHEEIAAVLDISTDNSRKLLSRAKEQLHKGEKITKHPVPADFVNKYLTVIQLGDAKQLEQFLHDEITLISDGGGKAVATTRPLLGMHRVTTFLQGVYNKTYRVLRAEVRQINHEPAILYYHGDQLVTCMVLSIENDRVEHFYFMRNPDKLRLLQK